MGDGETWTAMALLTALGVGVFVWSQIQEHFWQKDIRRERRDAGRDHAHPAE